MSAGTRIDAAGYGRVGPDLWNPAGASQASRKWAKEAKCYDDGFSADGECDRERKTTKLNTLKTLVVIGFSFLIAYAGSGPAFADTPSLPQQVAAVVQPQLDQYPAASLGVAVGVVEPGVSGAITTSIFYFGHLTGQNNDPISLNGTTEFEIGSVTKTFTTTVLASLIQQHPWLLDIPVNRIFPQTPRFKGQPTTIRDLADYTSGLPDSNRDGGSSSCTFSGGTIEDCYNLDLMFQHLSNPALSALQFAPGTAYLYSDLAVALLALAEPALAGSTAGDVILPTP